MKMAGLYIHIPFCRSRCIYCGFYSTTGLELRQRYVEAVCKEISMVCKDTPIRTIYLGGGTPSQLTIPQLQQIMNAAYIYNKVETDAEITIECNPDDVTKDFVEGLSQLPFNRVSMGAQTFCDKRLGFIQRRHNSSQVFGAVERLRDTGIRNISLDLMYGFPEETISEWEKDINDALSLGVEHLSAYCLMIEEGTPLYELRMKSDELRRSLPDEELERQMYELLIDRLTSAGYEHYEISNFAKPGFRSRHNSSYWDGTPYIGIGAAAHSYDIRSRSWNVADIKQYMEGIEKGNRIFEEELIDENTHYNDTVTVALRTQKGICLDDLSERHRDYCLKNARRFIADGLLHTNGHQLALTRQGLFVSDMIMSELVWVD